MTRSFRHSHLFSELQYVLLGAKKIQECQQPTLWIGRQTCHMTIEISAGPLCIFPQRSTSGALVSSPLCSTHGSVGVTCLCGKETAAGSFWFLGCIHPGVQLSLWAKFRQYLCVEAEGRFFTRPPKGGNNQLGSSVPVEQAVSCTIGQQIRAVPREGWFGYQMLPVDGGH